MTILLIIFLITLAGLYLCLYLRHKKKELESKIRILENNLLAADQMMIKNINQMQKTFDEYKKLTIPELKQLLEENIKLQATLKKYHIEMPN